MTDPDAAGLDALLAEIAESPESGDVVAFFDFDGTVVDGYSALAVLQHRASHLDIPITEAIRLVIAGFDAARSDGGFAVFMRAAVKELAGKTTEDLDKLGTKLLKGSIGGLLYPDAWKVVGAHKERGHRVVIASSALPFQVEPLARELGADAVLCTRPKVVDGVLTGTVDGEVLWGAGKAGAVRRYAADEGLDLGACFGYANGNEDVEFLSEVGRPHPVNPSGGLAKVAVERGWPVLHFDARGHSSLVSAARTAAAYGGLVSAIGASIGVGLINRSHRDAINMTISMGSEAALALAGVKLEVQGSEHLWEQRPAVFIFNHQSWLDGFVIMNLVRHDMTGVAKKEIGKQPGFGQLAWFAKIALIDRNNLASAKATMDEVVKRLDEGVSICLSPEGTRSPTPRLGRFKKGAFHMAMQGGVPIVPIVIRNTGELQWRGSRLMRSGTVDVVVHPPISVERWKVEDLDERVSEVRDLFVETLDHWPVPAHR